MNNEELYNQIVDLSKSYFDQETKQYKQKDDEVPVSGAVIYPEDIAEIVKVALEGWFTEGQYSREFVNLIRQFLGVKHSILVNSGSSANFLAVTACKDYYSIPDGMKVITCATAFPTTVAPIIQNNLIPFFIDIDPKTLTYDTGLILELLDENDVCGVILAHTLGFPFDAKSIGDKCKDIGKFFIEDCCDALGSELNGVKVGGFGDASTLSFFPAHHITTGEGGSVQTNDSKLFRLMQQYSSWGRDCWCVPGKDNTCGTRFLHSLGNLPFGFDHKYTFSKIGYNFKITEMQAALGASQMLHLFDFINQRRANYIYLFDNLKKELKNYVTFIPLGGASPFGFPVISAHIDAKVVRWLEDEAMIRTRPIFAGNLLLHPMMKDVDYFVAHKLDGSNFLTNHAIWVGCWPGLSASQLDYMIKKIPEAIALGMWKAK